VDCRGAPLRSLMLDSHPVSTLRRCLQVKFMAPQEVVAAQKQGTPVIDIRPRGEWESGHVPDSVNVEYLRLISGAALTSPRWHALGAAPAVVGLLPAAWIASSLMSSMALAGQPSMHAHSRAVQYSVQSVCKYGVTAVAVPIAGWSAWQVLRKLAFAFFGIANGTGARTPAVHDLRSRHPRPGWSSLAQ